MNSDLFNIFVKPIITMIDFYKDYLKEGIMTKEKVKNGIILYINLYFIFKSEDEKTNNQLVELKTKLTEWAIKTIEDFDIKKVSGK